MKISRYLVPLLCVMGLSVAITPLAVLAQSQEHQWVRFTTDNDDNVYKFDKKVSGRGRFRRYWSAVFYKKRYKIQWKKTLYSIDCGLHIRRIRMFVGYDESNKIVQSSEYSSTQSTTEKIEPNTPDSAIANAVCSLK